MDSVLTNREDAKDAKVELREDDAFDAVFENENVKVDEQTELMISHFKVGKNLGGVDGS